MSQADRTIGIYVIRNLNTDKCYVGGSTNVKRRIAQHRALMLAGCHPNPRLRMAVESSGIDRFEFKVVDTVASEENLAARELSWIHRLNAVRNGYNRTYRTEHFSSPRRMTPRSDWISELAAIGLAVLTVAWILF